MNKQSIEYKKVVFPRYLICPIALTVVYIGFVIFQKLYTVKFFGLSVVFFILGLILAYLLDYKKKYKMSESGDFMQNRSKIYMVIVILTILLRLIVGVVTSLTGYNNGEKIAVALICLSMGYTIFYLILTYIRCNKLKLCLEHTK